MLVCCCLTRALLAHSPQTPPHPCAVPVDNMDMVHPKITTTQNRYPSPTSVILNPLVGSWIPPTLKPTARLRAQSPSASDTPTPIRSTLDPGVRPWYRSNPSLDDVPHDPQLSMTPSTTQVGNQPNPLQQVASSTAKELLSYSSIDSFIRSRQQPTLAGPPLSDHPAASLLASYASDGCPAEAGPP